jgi:hypothetical protein
MIDENQEKLCPKCQQTKPVTLFRRRGDRPWLYRSRCFDCERLDFDRYNENHREARRVTARQHMEKLRQDENRLEAYRAKRLARLPVRNTNKLSYKTLLGQQNGVCAICKKTERVKLKNGDIKALAVDHDHATGQVRGLLCFKCNTNLAVLENEKFFGAAMEYLEKYDQ